MIRPNIFIIGIQKAGTTSLYQYLCKHPSIYGPSIKDYSNSHPFFMDQNYFENKREDFEKLFAKNPGHIHVITSEVRLFEKKEYLQRVKKYSPDGKIILSFRNPVERTKSMFNYYNQIGKNPYNYSLAEVLEKEPGTYLNRSLYYEKTKDLFSVFKGENIKIVYFEDLIGEKFPQVISEIYSFLGVKKTHDDFIHENKTGEVKYEILDKMLKLGQDTKVRDFLVQKILDPILDANQRHLLKDKFFKWNLKKGEENKNGLTLPPREKGLFKDDAQKLGELLGKDLIEFWNLH